jgi:putative flippase GtrA
MLNSVYCRYIGASAAALAFDFALFMLTMSLGVPPAPAAAIGYISGIVCHWLVSSRFVVNRWQQQALFVVTALVGLGITTAIVGVGSHEGLDPRFAKIIAIGVSFQVTYVLRKKVVFA